jgi:hypothetical protein
MYISMHVCMYVCILACIYACMHVCMLACIYAWHLAISLSLWKRPQCCEKFQLHCIRKADFHETWIGPPNIYGKRGRRPDIEGPPATRKEKRTLPRHGVVSPEAQSGLCRDMEESRHTKSGLCRDMEESRDMKSGLCRDMDGWVPSQKRTLPRRPARKRKRARDSAAQKRKVHQLLSCMMHYNSNQN